MSVSSSRSTATPYADTLDTGNSAVKVVLYNNGTYRYVKDPKAIQDDKVFTEHWDTRSVNRSPRPGRIPAAEGSGCPAGGVPPRPPLS